MFSIVSVIFVKNIYEKSKFSVERLYFGHVYSSLSQSRRATAMHGVARAADRDCM